MPLDISDFPDFVIDAFSVYNKLGDRIEANIGYLGKDFTTLPLHIKIMKVTNEELFLETLLLIDKKSIKDSAAEVKKQLDKISRKTSSSGANPKSIDIKG